MHGGTCCMNEEGSIQIYVYVSDKCISMCIDVDMYSPFYPSNIYCGAILSFRRRVLIWY